MSSLATQLAQNVSLNASLLVDRSRRKPTTSYLFTGREADQHDLEAIHALGVNAFLQLASVNATLEKYEDALFSERAKDTDRTLLPVAEAGELDKTIEEFLWLLSPYLLEPSTGKVIEWLVRRFRIYEFNIDATLSLFLPYHESPHFAKMLSILSLKPNSIWSFLIPYKSAAQSLPRVSLVTEMLKSTEVARFVASILPTAIKKGLGHRVLFAFNAASLQEFIKRSKSLNEGTMAYILPALLEPLQQTGKKLWKDGVLGSYILLATLFTKCELSPSALKTIIGVMSACASAVREDQFVKSLVAVCESQPELDSLSNKTVDTILNLPNVNEELASASNWEGSEKVLSPLVKSLCEKLDNHTAICLLESIIATQATPVSVIDALSQSLLRVGVNSEGETQINARRLLALIQQRQPDLVRKAMDTMGEQSSSLQESIDQLAISLSTIGQLNNVPVSQDGNNMIFASADADSKVRILAVKELVNLIDGKDLASIDDMETVRGILIARVQDTNAAVLEVLYARPASVTPIFASKPKAFLSSLSSAIESEAKPKRNVLRLHLTYLTSFFFKAVDSSVQEEIFHLIFFPFLLFSKPRQKTAELVWDIVVEVASGEDSMEWITGCSSIVKPDATSEIPDSVDSLNQMNYNIADKIAENIIKSPRFLEHFDALIAKLRDSHPHVKLMGYLIAISLVKQSKGSRQIETACKIMKAMNQTELSGIDDLSQEHLALESAQDRSLGKHIISKPNSKTTANWIQISLFAAISQISRPENDVLDWVAASELPMGSTNDGHRYVRLMRSIYQLANASTSVPVLSTTLLKILFVNLKGDALAFLAGIWSTSKVDEFKDSMGISLLHAAALLEAHILEDDGVDLQTILPTLLVGLQSSDPRICQGAMECISRIRILSERKLSSVYRFDTIYGQNDRTLQYLDQEDLKRYLNSLVEHRDHFMNDPSYLKVFHVQHLGRNKSDKKRDADYKHRIICYLLSHINALSSEIVQISLLKSIATITNKAKVQILLPTIQTVVQKLSSSDPATSFSPISEEFTTRILSCYDSVAATYLNETASGWDVFSQLLLTVFRSGIPLQSQEALAHAIESGLFSSLPQPRKFTLCEILLEVGSQHSSSLARRVLTTILNDVPLIVHLLELLAPAGATSSPRVSKRVKTIESSDDVLPRLSLLVEILGTKSLPGSLDLISNLLDTLSKIVQTMPAAQAEVSYIEQLLMSAVESAASKITEVPNISPSVIRLDILVEVIRVSGNPQTFHQALLLIANLARLAPESVLFNVMPVFTFMGSNVFHRDDSYSFKVVQQTIDGIVPVMVSSLKEAHSQPLDLYLASKEFLHVFSDAASHIPRHRRNKFFAHLVDVLGARDFLAPICMLLLEKMANRIIKQPPEEVQNSLSLPISVFQHCDYALQLRAASEILQESRRIVTHIADPQSIQPIFLEGIMDGDHSVSTSTILKRRAQALIIFVGYAFKPKSSTSSATKDDPSISSIIAQLITLAILPEGPSNDAKIEDISEAARLTMNRLLSGMSVADFSEAVQSMLNSGDVKVQIGALDLLSKRLPDVSLKMRPTLTGSVTKALASIKNILAIHKEGQVVVNAFNAVKSIASTMSPGEESPLTDLVPLAVSATKEKSLALSALGALSALSVKLGPRIIPFFRAIITQSITILRSDDATLFQDSFGILQGLLSTIPTFWGSGEVNQVVFLYMDQASSPSKPLLGSLATLTKSLAKRIPAKVLIPTLLDMWQSLQASVKLTRISAYFDVLSRALQHADRPTVLEHLRTSFKIFLDALDIVKIDAEAEEHVISAFKELVVKLNETAFKPLFRRLYDWAYIEDGDDVARKVTFGHLYINLLDYFKGLMVPYMAFLLQPFDDTLAAFSASTLDSFALWSSTVQILTRALNYDDGGFWRDDKLRHIATPLTSQVEVCVRLGFVDGKPQLQDALAALVENANDDTLLKSINLAVLMHTRSEDHRVRLFALTCSEALWRSNGGKLLGFVAETATFISECSEDENDVVVKECFKLKDAVESVAGAIDGL